MFSQELVFQFNTFGCSIRIKRIIKLNHLYINEKYISYGLKKRELNLFFQVLENLLKQNNLEVFAMRPEKNLEQS